MAEIWFYHLERATAAELLPSLLRRGLERGLKLSVQTVSQDHVQSWSQRLWGAEDVSFLAHGFAGEPYAALQPIWISYDAENANGSSYRFFVDGALPDLPCAYERASLLFDGRNEGEAGVALELQRKASLLGIRCRYLRQDERGQWRDVTLA